jgi:hypothetical protein
MNVICPSTIELSSEYSTTLPVPVMELSLVVAEVPHEEIRIVKATNRTKSLKDVFIRYSFGNDYFQ